jgi:hypothetical protein
MVPMKKLFAVILLLLAANAFAQENSAPQKFALVIGNGNYTSFGSLANALNDANDISDALQSLGFTVDKVLDANRAQMAESIIRLKNRLSVSKNSYGFVFYAGHGVQVNGVNYLIPAKADIPSANYLGDTAVSVQTMLAELNDAGNELNVVVLDACRDFPAVWSRSTNRGLSVVANQPADSIIVYATSAGSTASDGTGRNGLFTSQLLKNLARHDLDVSEVFRRTGADVSQASNRQQIPAVYNQFFGTAYLGQSPARELAAEIVQPVPVPMPKPIPAPKPPKEKTVRSGDEKIRSFSIMNNLGFNSGFNIVTASFPEDLWVYIELLEFQYALNDFLNISIRPNVEYWRWGEDYEWAPKKTFAIDFMPGLILRPLKTRLAGWYIGAYIPIGELNFQSVYRETIVNNNCFLLGIGLSSGYQWTFKKGLTIFLGAGWKKIWKIPSKNNTFKLLPEEYYLHWDEFPLIIDAGLGYSF